ncbi:MAG: CoB--CoM heterodisulfide reductase iron-sulfur subunit B family protein [Candidatus Thorarchaeota archaeon]|jgi:heterodisulfide reductase subunit B
MDEILLYRGCTTPVRLPAYEATTKLVLERLGMPTIDMTEATCCGAQYVESLNEMAFYALGGRLLAMADQEGKDILAICGACSGSLKHTKYALDNDESKKDELNSLLEEEGLKYTGKSQVKHLLQVIREDIGYRALERAITKPYDGVPLAAHYGCHVTRPHDIARVDDPENPSIIDKVIELAGGVPVRYAGRTRCCGGPLLAMDETAASKIGAEKIMNVRAAGALGVVTACAFCDIQLTQVQFGEGANGNERIPVLPLTQFLGPALGIDENSLGFHLNRISADPVLAALKEGR